MSEMIFSISLNIIESNMVAGNKNINKLNNFLVYSVIPLFSEWKTLRRRGLITEKKILGSLRSRSHLVKVKKHC